VEDGSPNWLMKRKGAYYDLMCREMSRLTRRAA